MCLPEYVTCQCESSDSDSISLTGARQRELGNRSKARQVGVNRLLILSTHRTFICIGYKLIHPRDYVLLTFREAEFIIIRHTGTDRFPPHSLFSFYFPPSFSLISFTPGGENVSFLLLQISPIHFLKPVDSRQTGTHILLNAYDPQNYAI